MLIVNATFKFSSHTLVAVVMMVLMLGDVDCLFLGSLKKFLTYAKSSLGLSVLDV